MSKANFGIQVTWPVGDGQWQDTTSDVKEAAGIARYRLSATDSGYTLEFSNTEHYDYHFYDATGDSYEVNTFRNGDHSVGFSSAKPTVLFVTGS